MSDSPDSAASAGSDSPGENQQNQQNQQTRRTADRVRRGLDYALLGGLVLLGFIAAVQFYFAADRTIAVWVTREYRPVFKMVFNLVVLLVVGIGLSWQVRRLMGDDSFDSESAPSDAP